MATPSQKRANLAVSKVVPPVLLGVVAYASYAVTKQLCIDILFHPLPSHNGNRRVGAGAAIITIYYLLLIPMVATYIRLLYNVLWNSAFVPLSTQHINPDSKDSSEQHNHHRKKSRRSKTRDTEKPAASDTDLERGVKSLKGIESSNPAGLDSFYTKNVFVCEEDGRPAYCSTCCQFKPDRSHHCREVDRCVRKMDHFCPWVGGVVSETSFKFFIQFVSYTAIFCGFTLIICAYYTAELRRNTGGVNPHLCVCIGLAGLFGFFSGGMSLTSVQMASLNITTIENLNRHTAVWTLAIRVPEHLLERLWVADSPWAPTFRTVSYPTESLTCPSRLQAEHQIQGHVFAILNTQPGENPFDLGSPYENLKQVMGYSVVDWLLPLKHSPCADHSSPDSTFALGPAVARLKEEAGLVPPPESIPSRPQT
ncbi:hypothetical protein N7495_000845 [Penicillium taxi]|uniref:uncharacterized protein n=1 Tax=Penicillium taxi TaxID=168475 RepID=UPI0025455B60|nr:uncharacterized protein N7495_000845 [Penicillium taxi]KAJ5908163.1 hypothetical protein N7495_000845 [Penicillium taxi]